MSTYTTPAAGRFVERKPPRSVEAILWTGQNWTDVAFWLDGKVESARLDPDDPTRIFVWFDDGRMQCRSGEWLVRDGSGETCTLTAERFAKLYAPVDAAPCAECGGKTIELDELLPGQEGSRCPLCGRSLWIKRLVGARERLRSFSLIDEADVPLAERSYEAGKAAARVEVANNLDQLAAWRAWARVLLCEPGSLLDDAQLRRKVASVVEAPSVIAVDDASVFGYSTSMVGGEVVAEQVGASVAVPRGVDLNEQLSSCYQVNSTPLIVEACARVANDVYREVMSGDEMPKWDDADPRQKDVARETVRAALAGVSPRTWHARWRAEKEAGGWRYDPIRSDEQKLHPNLVPYAQLPAGQRLLDDVFVAAVKATRRAIACFEATFPPLESLRIQGADVPQEKIDELKRELAGSAWKTPVAVVDSVEFLPAISRAVLENLFAEHCECRPLDTARISHSHDCDVGITDDVRTALHRVAVIGFGDGISMTVGPPLRSATDTEVSAAVSRIRTRLGGTRKQ